MTRRSRSPGEVADVGRYQLLPDLAGDDYARLRDDIAERGVLVPVEVDEDGQMLDGHHRQRIAAELGVDCPSVVRRGLAEHEKRLHTVALNLVRRQLTEGQKVILGRQVAPDIEKRAAERMTAGKPTDPSDNCHQGRATDEVAAAVGLGSGRTYERNARAVEKIEHDAPDLYARVASGAASIPDARRELRHNAKAARVAEIAAKPVADLPAHETFPVLYADPPWRYEHVETPQLRAVENNYPTMTVERIAALDVPVDDDAVCLLWATVPKLSEALHVLETWGFVYRTNLVWIKDRIGMGYYVRGQHELLLVGKRGELPVPDPADRPPSVIQAPRGEHSAKPAEVYELIERMYPRYRRCELFARQSRPGWTAWGNQIEAVA
jgi:N6-adenosine-specific RNA methylase IME4